MIGVAGNRRRGEPLLMKVPEGIFISKRRRMPERSLAERNLHREPVYNCALINQDNHPVFLSSATFVKVSVVPAISLLSNSRTES